MKYIIIPNHVKINKKSLKSMLNLHEQKYNPKHVKIHKKSLKSMLKLQEFTGMLKQLQMTSNSCIKSELFKSMLIYSKIMFKFI